MLEKSIREQVIELIHQQVVPAVGCAEPTAVALCTARAIGLLGQRPEHISVLLSANILGGAMGVSIPGAGMIDLPIIIAISALVDKSGYQLEVIKDLIPDTLEVGKTSISENRVDVELKDDITKRLYIEITCEAEGHHVTVIIIDTHTNIVFEEKDGAVPLDKVQPSTVAVEKASLCLNLGTVWESATTTSVDEIEFILGVKRYNLRTATEALKGNYGHCLDKIMDRPLSRGIFGSSIFSHVIAKTASACDARMGGVLIPMMSNSGSGNQGVCTTNPVAVLAKENEDTREELTRALTLSRLIAIYIKQSLGALSALCGCVVASAGSSCGITYLMRDNYINVCHSVKNMIANLMGMVCDGVKPSCPLKILSGVSTAILSTILSMEGKHITSTEGIIDKDVSKSIRNLTSIGKGAICITGDMVLNIMTHKCS